MGRRSGCLGVLLLSVSLAGCNMCQNCYDYCGSVIGPNGYPNCEFAARQGSILAPPSDSPPIGTLTEEPTPAVAAESTEDSPPEAETAENEPSDTVIR